MSERAFHGILLGLLGAGMAARVAYVLTEPAVDPTFASPVLEGRYYTEWARELAAGGAGPPGAYYLPPLYPLLLSWFFRLAGESFVLLYLFQHGALVATAGLLGLAARRRLGAGAAVAAVGLLLLYRPTLTVASHPSGEPLALLLAAVGLWAYGDERRRGAGGAGLAWGLAGLARPSLLLVPLLWGLAATLRRRWSRAALLAAGVVVAVLPVAVRNRVVSGHAVPVSANAGITFYQGNAPGAIGVHTRLTGMSGDLSRQRAEATQIASRAAGRPLDPVEADRWWGIAGLRARAERPVETTILLTRKLRLSLAAAEIGLESARGVDDNPWRHAAPVSLGVLLGLAVAAVLLGGLRGSGGRDIWLALLGCAVTLLVFYVSSRHRFPAAVLLCLPAGAGLASIVRRTQAGAGHWAAAGVALAVAVASIGLPTPGVGEFVESSALAQPGLAREEVRELDAAERGSRDARAAGIALDPAMLDALQLYDPGAAARAPAREE